MTKEQAIHKVISIAQNEVGYLEKASNSGLDSKTGNAGSANYTKYWRDIKPSYQGEPWCACFVTWCLAQAFGKDKAAMLLRHYPYVYCPTMESLFPLNANPKRGDIVIFKRNGTFVHTGIVTAVDGDYFETIEGNTSGGSSIVANGGGVFRKSYYNSNLPGTKFITPDWSIAEEDIDMEKLNELEQRITALEQANKPEMIYNYIDKNMPKWAHEAVKWCVDNGIIKGVNNKGDLGLNDVKLWVCVVVYRLGKLMIR